MFEFLKQFAKYKLLSRLILTQGRTDSNAVALTFDDGPDIVFTEKVLEVLKHHNAVATFFLVGKKAQESPELVQKILEGGHEIGNHSMTHAEFIDLGWQATKKEIDDADDVLSSVSGDQYLQTLHRPPKGVVNIKMLIYCILNKKKLILWNKDPKDFAATSARNITDYFTKDNIVSGDIILLHDKNQYTVDALEALLQQVKNLGLETANLTSILSASKNQP